MRLRRDQGRSRTLILCALASLTACSSNPSGPPPPVKPGSPEAKEGFVSLFNGNDLDGWDTSGSTQGSFSVEYGILTGHKGGNGWIRTEAEYSDFELRLEYRISRDGNSGVFFRAAADDPVYKGMEIQIRDDEGKPPNNHRTGALYDVIEPSDNMSRPTGEWNSLLLMCDGPNIKVRINGKTVINDTLDRFTEPVGEKFKTPYKDMPRRGHIGLQNHGDDVWYRDVRIREIGN